MLPVFAASVFSTYDSPFQTWGRPVAAVATELERRDRTDAAREVAPLRQAEDAHRVDTSDLTLEETVDRVVALVEEARARRDGAR